NNARAFGSFDSVANRYCQSCSHPLLPFSLTSVQSPKMLKLCWNGECASMCVKIHPASYAPKPISRMAIFLNKSVRAINPSSTCCLPTWMLVILILSLVPTSARAQAQPESRSNDPVAEAAATILITQCLTCHGPSQKKGGLDLSRRAAALKGGK